MSTKAKEISPYEYAQIEQFIYRLYMTYARGMEYEECRNIALLEYAEARKNRNKRIRDESPFSLNQTLGESSELVYTYFFPVQGDFVKSLCMWNDIKGLGKLPHKILTMLYQGYDDSEIIKRLSLPPMQYYEIKREIRSQLVNILSYRSGGQCVNSLYGIINW